MDKAEVIKKLRKYKQLLSEHMAFEALILFGSYAKGTEREDSDMDVAVIVDKLQGDYFTIHPLLWKIRRMVDDRIEPVVLERQNDESGFFSAITKYGILI